ncbi:hypothetical protein A1O1_04525 [Capronia coronata CBS 617.96]|uniref:Uncharacterized protein n=1 Tax=Capronia coronata CBS 617.96 TaxID=1182541 RepID=W9YFW7_9EURO|nr:uncharacterized protein A1O1_04525 [Capronia coronata CBS 617.96]EXJ91413.1 hypothetical protein A1O1_04525 [Capronia coronata CBS 617.96]
MFSNQNRRGPRRTPSHSTKPGDHQSYSTNKASLQIGQLNKPHCECSLEAVEVWSLIQNVHEVGLDIVMAASEQSLELWGKSQDCQSCPTSFYETLLKVYERLVDWLESAIATYRSLPAHQSTTAENAARIETSHSVNYPAIKMARLDRPQPRSRDPANASGNRTICLPSSMSLGEYEFDEEQSRHLALDLVVKQLRGLASALHQLQQIQLENGHGMKDLGSSLNITFSRTMRLLSTRTAALAEE